MKIKKKALNALYPTPTVIVGANVNGKPNFITIAHIGIMTLKTVSLGINKIHYTNSGIKENNGFSINIPSESLVVETDYCGIASGKNSDKSKLFKVFYGELPNTPMIDECLVNMECRLLNVIDMSSHEVFVGEVVNTYADESVITEEQIDISKIKPLLFDMSSKKYWSLGSEVAKCWSIGKKLIQ